MTILFLSTRRDGRSLGQMARDELGPFGGFAALIGTLLIWSFSRRSWASSSSMP
jgi:carbon starvation protein